MHARDPLAKLDGKLRFPNQVGLALSLMLVLVSAAARAQDWVPGKAVNDPMKERLCKERASKENGAATFDPFEIDARFVAEVRAAHPEATFIVSRGSGMECYVNPGTGRFQVNQFGGIPIRVVRPPEAGRGIQDRQDQEAAANVCYRAARAKDKTSEFDHSQWWLVTEVPAPGSLGPALPKVARVRPAQYDIFVSGTLYFKTSGLDLTTDNFLCLLTPTLQIRAIQTGVHDRRRFPLTP